MARLVFLVAAAVVVWVYLGYPILLAIVARVRRRPVARAPIEPSVTLIVCAYNEEAGIRRKLEEIVALDYPSDRLELIVASDGSTDRTDAIVLEFAPRVSLLRVEGRGGKTIAQNVAVSQARGEILIFSDVTTVYVPHTIRTLVSNFADPTIGCVGGDLRYESERRNPSAEGRALFWSYERRLRLWETGSGREDQRAGLVAILAGPSQVVLKAVLERFSHGKKLTERLSGRPPRPAPSGPIFAPPTQSDRNERHGAR
jgi:cellulose synthase/poly-beta-1,6-N-acetylglucosamine synthase-like glycosyltransferase